MGNALIACCCGSTENDDDAYATGDRRRLFPADGSNSLPSATTTTGGYGSTTSNGSGRPAPLDEEQAVLQRILVQTQQNIIDVSQLEQTAAGHEFINRSTKYDELVRRADRTHNARPVTALARPQHGQGRGRCLLADTGNHVADELSRRPMSGEQLTGVRETTAAVTDAFRQGIRVEHRQELVVHMSSA